MPNWTYQNLTFDSIEDLNKLINAIKPKGSDEVFSFSWVFPEPEDPEKCVQLYGKKYVNSLNDFSGENARSLSYPAKSEWFNWYDWHIDFWGTKWNCCEPEISGSVIQFNTAWAPAVPIYEALAKNFPDIHFRADWAEEQGAACCGYFDSNNDELVYYDSYSDEAYEQYNNICGETYSKIDGEWHYFDDEGVFETSDGYHYFDLDDFDKEKAKELHKKYGKSFDSVLKDYLKWKNDDEDFAKFCKEELGLTNY